MASTDNEDMGKVAAKVRLSNHVDLVELRERRLDASRVRSMEADALVETSATV